MSGVVTKQVAPKKTSKQRPRTTRPDSATSDPVRIGIDLGTGITVVAASRNGAPIELQTDLFPTVVRADGDEVLFSQEALNSRPRADLNHPVRRGFVQDVEVCKMFVRHVLSVVDPEPHKRFWGVVGIPDTWGDKDKLLQVMSGLLERVLVIPSPYLVAVGLHQNPELTEDSTTNLLEGSLIVDIGTATTRLCLVRGALPAPEDQMTLNKAGDFVDETILRSAHLRYPNLQLTHSLVKGLKEEQAYVEINPVEKPAAVAHLPELLSLADLMSSTCDELLLRIVEGIQKLLGRCDSNSVDEITKNIIVVGGGSRIRGFSIKMEHLLRERGFSHARTLLPTDYRWLVADGGLQIAESMSDDHWENVPANVFSSESVGVPV